MPTLTQILQAPQSLWTNAVPTDLSIFNDLPAFSVAPKTYGSGRNLEDESLFNKNKVNGNFGNGFFHTYYAGAVVSWMSALGKNNPNGVQTFTTNELNYLVDTYIVGQAPVNAKFIIVDFEPADPTNESWMWDYAHSNFKATMVAIAQRVESVHGKYFYDWITNEFKFTFNGENYDLNGANNDGFANNNSSTNSSAKILAVHRNTTGVSNIINSTINQVGLGYTAITYNAGANSTGILDNTKWRGVENTVLKSIDGLSLKAKLTPNTKTVAYYWPLEDKPVSNPGRRSNIYTKFKPNSKTSAYPQNLSGKVTVNDNRLTYPSNIIEDSILVQMTYPNVIHAEYWLHGSSYNPYAQMRYSSINGNSTSCIGGSFKTGNYQGNESSLPCPSDLGDYIGTESRTLTAFIKGVYRYAASGIKDVLNGTQVQEVYQFQYKRTINGVLQTNFNTSVFENHTGQAALAWEHSQPLLLVWRKPSTNERVIIFWDVFADAYAPTTFKFNIGATEYTGTTKGNRAYVAYLADGETTTLPATTTTTITTTVASGQLNPAIRPFSERKVVWNGADINSTTLWYDAINHGVQCFSYLDFYWGMIERTQGVYNFDELDWLLNKFNNDGVKLILNFRAVMATPNAINLWTIHNKVGNSFVTQSLSPSTTSYFPESSYDLDRYGNKANYNANLGAAACFAYHDTFIRNRFFEYVARVCDYIHNHPLKGVVEGIMLIDGGLTETGFNVQYDGIMTDIGYNDSNIAVYRTFLQSKYGSISSLNSAWGSNFGSFNEINRSNMPKTADNTYDMTYNEGEGQRDWYRFKLKTHREFYQQFVNTVKNPSLQVNSLATATGLNTFAYLTENFSSGQGRTWGVAAFRYMYEMFDCYFSSTTSGTSPNHTNSFLGDVQLRNMLLLGTFGNKPRGQEQDNDPVDSATGQSRTAKLTFDTGAKYTIVALQNDSNAWLRNVLSDDGVTRTYKEDVLRTKTLYCTNQTPTPITPAVTLNYYDADILTAPHNPTNVVEAWKTATNINSNSNGTMSQVVAINCISNLV